MILYPRLRLHVPESLILKSPQYKIQPYLFLQYLQVSLIEIMMHEDTHHGYKYSNFSYYWLLLP